MKTTLLPARFMFFIVLLAAASAGCTLLPEEKVEEIPTLIEAPPSRAVTYAVQVSPIVEEIRGLARVAPTLETNLYFTQSGRIFYLDAEPGQVVTEGDILARLETGPLEHQLRLAEVDLEMSRLRLTKLQAQAVPLDVRMQRLDVERNELQVKYVRERLTAATIRAPHDGIIQSVRTQVGELVEEYDTLVVVADPTALELQVEVRRDDEASKLARGQTALVEVSRDQWEPARVIQITEPLEEESPFSGKTVHLELEDDPAALGLELDDLVTARIAVQEREKALVIPLAGLREFMGRTYVRLLDGETRREVDVEVGIRTPTEVEILKGLSQGDIVIGK